MRCISHTSGNFPTLPSGRLALPYGRQAIYITDELWAKASARFIARSTACLFVNMVINVTLREHDQGFLIQPVELRPMLIAKKAEVDKVLTFIS